MGWRVLDCAQATCLRNRPNVPADPDVAGIGVILGFLITTLLAFLIAFTVLFLDRIEDIVNFYRRHFQKDKPEYEQNHVGFDHEGPYWRSITFWSRVLSKNLLSLSDTQLLTGLAIQITAMIKHCSMSVYHFRIVVDLAFLTTVTHLLTVVTLRNYFVKNKWMNLPRIFFMLANLGLLGYTSFVAYSYDLADVALSDSLACFFHKDRPRFPAAFGGKWALLLICAIGGHVAVIAAMYWLKDPKASNKKGRWYWYIWYIGAVLRTWLVAPSYAIYGIYMATTGLSETQALGHPPQGVHIDGDERHWNFGQFLPVLLLALPIFAAWESFWEEKDEDRDNWFGRPGARKSRNTKGMQSLDLGSQMNKTGAHHSRDPSAEERYIESHHPSPADSAYVTPKTSPLLQLSLSNSTLQPSHGSEMWSTPPGSAAGSGPRRNFS